MTDKELRKLNRKDLLEMLIQQGKELEELRTQLNEAQERLKDRRITVDKAGSIAQAALQLNGVFEAAQKAADQYLENLRMINEESRGKMSDSKSREVQSGL